MLLVQNVGKQITRQRTVGMQSEFSATSVDITATKLGYVVLSRDSAMMPVTF